VIYQISYTLHFAGQLAVTVGKLNNQQTTKMNSMSDVVALKRIDMETIQRERLSWCCAFHILLCRV